MCNELIPTIVRKLFLIFMLLAIAHQPSGSMAASVVSCDIQHGPCTRKSGDMTIIFDVLPKPVRTLSELHFLVTLKRNNAPITDSTVALDLSMPGMYMGKNRPVLKHRGQGEYQGTGIITRCTSGQKIWQARVTVGRDKPTIVQYQFEVQ
jgi:hypothetical protein